MLERRLQSRINKTEINSKSEYLEYLVASPDEVDKLVDAFTINVSSFFRNPFAFEFLANVIVPEIYHDKISSNDKRLRIWSAGCSYGEEPYTMAMILSEILEKEEKPLSINIFASDINKKVIDIASKGLYKASSFDSTKYAILNKYFDKESEIFKIKAEIKKMVNFSVFDLLEPKLSAPPDSIYGAFDITLCRNVLIYVDLERQNIIFNKLYHSLNMNGILVLGEAEVPVGEYKDYFRRESKYSKIYRKIC